MADTLNACMWVSSVDAILWRAVRRDSLEGGVRLDKKTGGGFRVEC